MIKKSQTTLTALSVLTTIGSLATVRQASADTINAQTFVSSMSTKYTLMEEGLFGLTASDPAANQRKYYISTQYNFLNDPMVTVSEQRDVRENTIISSFHTLDIGVGIYTSQKSMIAITLPLNVVHMPDQPNQFALGDTRLQYKFRMTDDNEPLSVSMIPELKLPTGNRNLFLSNNTLAGGVLFALEHDFGGPRMTINFGARHSPGALYQGLDYRTQLPGGLGLYFPLGPKWALNTEVNGALSLPMTDFTNPGELYIGLRHEPSSSLSFNGGASIGSFNPNNSGNLRILFGIKFSPADAPSNNLRTETRLSKNTVKPAIKPATAPIVLGKAPQSVPDQKIVKIDQIKKTYAATSRTSIKNTKKIYAGAALKTKKHTKKAKYSGAALKTKKAVAKKKKKQAGCNCGK